MEKPKKKNKGGIWTIIAGLVGFGFIIGSAQSNSYPMDNLWDTKSILWVIFCSVLVAYGIFKLVKR